MIIAHTKNWENKIDEQTIETLNKIYNSWQGHINAEKQDKIDKETTITGGGFDVDYWEGTEEEYQEALKRGEINENTKCSIYEYTTL